MNKIIKARDKAILTGLYLSKFDKDALKKLGFISFIEAFNTIGYSININPASIKNYRDEFDPYFPNSRKGWHKRKTREYCYKFYTDFSDVNFKEFTNLIKSFLIDNYDLEQIIPKRKKDKSDSVAKRLITGRAAEEYFKKNYKKIIDFQDLEIKDTTLLGCGFDFKVFNHNQFYGVEVKGLQLQTGNISLTEKEFLVAGELKKRYCLFVVLNFREKPFHQCFFNPLECNLSFSKSERQITQINYTTSI